MFRLVNAEITARSASIGTDAIAAQVLIQCFGLQTFVRHSLLSLTMPKRRGFLHRK